MLITATITDQIGRRPLTIYPYAVTALADLCLGIIGCFDYTKPATSSLLVRYHLPLGIISLSLTVFRFSSPVWPHFQPLARPLSAMPMQLRCQSSDYARKLLDGLWPCLMESPLCSVSAPRL